MQNNHSILDYGVVFILLGLCAFGILISLLAIFGVPLLIGEGSELASVDALNHTTGFALAFATPPAAIEQVSDSPVELPFIVNTPALKKGSTLQIIASDGTKPIALTDCLAEMEEDESYVGMTQVLCNATVPYNYASTNTVQLRAMLEPLEGESFVTNKLAVSYDWTNYQDAFWSVSVLLIAAILAGFIFVVLPIAIAMYYVASKEKHHIIYEGEYTLTNLFNPFRNVKKPSEFLQAFIASPLFWMAELVGIVIFLIYLSLSADAFKSAEAMVAFLLSGGIAFFTPFLWVAIWWFADYKEREPLRLLVSLFLWGAFACLMAIGLNTFLDSILVAVGLGALAAALFPPIIEELFKGTGLVLFSLHHEYDGVNDGLVFGFTVGMGFAFVENWLYLIGNPMGANMGSWLLLFFLRSIMFSAMHGVYTSMTGGIIGYLKSTNKPQVLLSGFAMLPAMLFHAIHNSVDIFTALLGGAGALAYCCLIAPFFDYGGLLLVAIVMLAWLMLSKKEE